MNHKQLILAREYRGLSQTQLAKAIDGLSQSNLSKFEKGINVLSEEVISKIISYLNFPVDFFDENMSTVAENAHYRKKATITKKLKIQFEYTNKFVSHIIDQMADSIEWPEFTFPTIDLEEDYSPEYAARFIRKFLGLQGGEPVANIMTLVESKGVIIVEISTSDKFDGVSFLTDKGHPVIILNKEFPNDRKRFSIAHELGHIIMHLNFPIPKHRSTKTEDEANAFASEFLMPANAIKSSLFNLKFSHLAELKRYWLTSMASIVRRAYTLNCIDKNRYTYLNIELSRSGQKKKESVLVDIDSPSLFQEGYRLHKEDLDYSDEELARAFKFPIEFIQKFIIEPLTKTKSLKVV